MRAELHTERVRLSDLDPVCSKSHPQWLYVVACHTNGDFIIETESVH